MKKITMLLFAILSMLTVQSAYASSGSTDGAVGSSDVSAGSSVASTCTDKSPTESVAPGDTTGKLKMTDCARVAKTTGTEVCCKSNKGVYTYIACMRGWTDNAPDGYSCSSFWAYF